MAGNETSRDTILSELAILLNVYIDYGNLDVPMAIQKCTVHYLIAAVPVTSADHMIHQALSAVMNKICSTLFYVRQLLLEEETEASSDLMESKSALKSVIDYLNWTTWKACGKCGYDEIYFVAIWPWGLKEDHDHPSCMKGEVLSNRQGYWNMGGRSPRAPPKNETRSGVDEL
jgi:hypothetical protein